MTEYHITVTQDEKEALDKLDEQWESLSTIQGVHFYYLLLGVERAGIMIAAVCAGEKCHCTVMEGD